MVTVLVRDGDWMVMVLVRDGDWMVMVMGNRLHCLGAFGQGISGGYNDMDCLLVFVGREICTNL